jgi:hypothetical protein
MKYKIWNKTGKKFFNPKNLTQTHEGESLCLYSGAKDFQGNELYDGDILCENGDTIDFYLKVYYKNYAWRVGNEFLCEYIDTETGKVFEGLNLVGNVFEHHSLMGDKVWLAV